VADDDDSELPPDPLVPDEDVKERAKLQQRRRRARSADVEETEFWERVFADPVGRRVMWAFLESCSTFGERFANGPNGFPQAEASWYRAGERDTGLRMWRSWLRAVPDGVCEMMHEHDPALKDAPRARRRRIRSADV
jgi:hypothetical protein